MEKTQLKKSGYLLVAAIIWGCAFVAQRTGGDHVGPYSFNGVRSIIGSVALLPVVLVMNRLEQKNEKLAKSNLKMLIKGGICCGIFLFLASTAQQLGLYYGTTAGKAGFLTAAYILIVPIAGIFLHKKCGINVWLAVVIALVGLYLLCMKEKFQIQKGDLLILACAFLFTAQILCVDYFSPHISSAKLSCMEFLVVGICSLVPMYCMEIRPIGMTAWLAQFANWDLMIALLYAGVLSCGVAYTFQIVGQNGLNPTVASLLMSLESVFSVIAGALLLGERMTGREICGSVILFGAIIVAQLPESLFQAKKTDK